MSSIENLSPSLLWKHFYQLTQCPRPSKKEQKVVAYIKDFCHTQQLEFKQDKIGNVIICKPAAPGFEQVPSVVLQGHMDMVCQKNAEIQHDFESDPIKAYVDGDWVIARDTTLGADNGIGVAAALAVLESDLNHGPLEVLLTIDEESGMTGASNLERNLLKSDILINLDSEGEGKLYVGCAGGIDVIADVSYEIFSLKTSQSYSGMEISISGLLGGHSGLDIHKGRGNAIKILNRLLKAVIVDTSLSVFVSAIEGGSLRNAIPREAVARLVMPTNQYDKAFNIIEKNTRAIHDELFTVEKNIQISFSKIEASEVYIDPDKVTLLIEAIDVCPHGVVRMSESVEGIPETSNNLAKVESRNGQIRVDCMTRSFIDKARDDTAAAIVNIFSASGGDVTCSGAYPGWTPNLDSKVLARVQHCYETLYGEKPEVKVIHAGLECGLLGEAYPNWDMVSFGPTIVDAHSPDEKVNIGSVERFWDLLVHVLGQKDAA